MKNYGIIIGLACICYAAGFFVAPGVTLAILTEIVGTWSSAVTSIGLGLGGKGVNYCSLGIGGSCTVRVYNDVENTQLNVECHSKDDAIRPKVLNPGEQLNWEFGLKGTTGFWQTLFYCYVTVVGKPGRIVFDVFNGNAPLDDNHWHIREQGVYLTNKGVEDEKFYDYSTGDKISRTDSDFTLWTEYDQEKGAGGNKLQGMVDDNTCQNLPQDFQNNVDAVTVCDYACVVLYDATGCGGETSAGELQAGKGCKVYYLPRFKNRASAIQGCNGRVFRAGMSLADTEWYEKHIEEEEGKASTPAPAENVVHPTSACGKRIVGYFPSWGTTSFRPSQAKLLTHAIFAFFEMHEDGSLSLNSEGHSRLNNFVQILKAYPHLKGMFAVGGWENSQYFSSIAQSSNKRATFISSVKAMFEKYPEFVGVDIDWEYPVTGGAVEGVAEDKANYVTLMRELKEGLSKNYIVSLAGAAGQWTLDPGFDIMGLLEHVDFVNVMSYDYFGAWASEWGAYTGPPSPLYYGNPVGFSGKVNADWTMKYYVCKSKQPHKINMGVPFYGRYWNNVGESIDPKDGMWRMSSSTGGVFQGGYAPWREIKANYGASNGFTQNFHDTVKSPYAFNAATRQYLGFENEQSLKYKVEYAIQHNLGGIMVWAIDQDDDEDTLLKIVGAADLCSISDNTQIVYKCLPISIRRWWTLEDDPSKGGMCGKEAPLFDGYYPVCDPDDPGYSCCGTHGFCGSGPDFCSCPTCKDYRSNPDLILQEPVKPSGPIRWHLGSDGESKRGRCGREAPLLATGGFAVCNPDSDSTYCCSQSGWCGSGSDFCDCDGCINFKSNPDYEFKPKAWWSWSDGADKAGRCGASGPKLQNGALPGCDPDSKESHCCSSSGWCGSGPEFCDCVGCKNFKK